MEPLFTHISRRTFISWVLVLLLARAALVAPFFVQWFSSGIYSTNLHVLGLWADLCTLLALCLLSARRLTSLGKPPAWALLTLLPIIKFVLVAYLGVSHAQEAEHRVER